MAAPATTDSTLELGVRKAMRDRQAAPVNSPAGGSAIARKPIRRGSAFEGFSSLFDGTGNAGATVPQTVQTKCVLDYDLVRLCQDYGDKPHKGDALGTLPELWPFDMLKRPLKEHAQEFVRQIGSKGYQPLTNVEAFQIYGPYMEKIGSEPPVWYTPEEGNHLIPPHQRLKAVRVFGYRSDEFTWHKGAAFLIVGRFTRHARYGHVSEETGRIIV